tara:strand:+ start:328 stop:453 length:126 start_codon:yes stop_codon:yes gene_type:complete
MGNIYNAIIELKKLRKPKPKPKPTNPKPKPKKRKKYDTKRN